MKKLNIVSFDEAYTRVFNLVDSELSVEYVSLFDALSRVLAEDIICQKNLPSFNNSAMDGFAFNYKDIGKKLKVKKTIYAGKNIEPCLEKNECYKIMTGAKVPDDADTIIPFENCIEYDENYVILPKDIKKGNAFRFKGEEYKEGSVLLHKGDVLNSSKIALLASQGISTVLVYKKLSIAIFSTGDELKEPWQKAREDEIYNANSFSIKAVLNEHGFCADYCGVIPDNLKDSIEYFKKMKKYDAIITSGGISLGEADFIEDALKANGFKESFHGINLKPGKPTMFGKLENSLVASMPGNPLAAYINSFLILIPALKKLQGHKEFSHRKILVKNAKEFKLKSGRVNLVLGSVEDSNFFVYNNNKYGSGMIKPIKNSNAIFISNENETLVEQNRYIEIIFFS